ncbi:MAG: chemotaxis protein CheW [Gloeomargarita sp. HHBFW_bins_162]
MVTPAISEYFAVQVGDKVRLALPAAQVQAVAQITPQDVCPMPGVPGALVGVVNRLGQLYWVLDLGEFLGLTGLAAGEYRPFTTVVVGVGNRRLALVVTALEGIFTPEHPQVLPLPQQLQRRYRELLSGLVSWQGKTLAVLRPETLFAQLV